MADYYGAQSGQRSRKRREGLSSKAIKILAGILTFCGMLGTSVLSAQIPTDTNKATLGTVTAAMVMVLIQLAAVPMYAWELVEGFNHTRSKWRYFARLVVLAAVSEIPWDMATYHYERISKGVESSTAATAGHSVSFWFDPYTQNPVWALAVALLVIICLDCIRRQPSHRITPATAWLLRFLLVFSAVLWIWLLNLGLLGSLLHMGLLTLVFALIFFALQKKENTMMYTAGFVGALTAVFPALGLLAVHARNGKNGFSTPAGRWMWYMFYVVALLGLGLIAVHMGGNI